MRLIIDIPERVVTAIQNGEDYRYDIHTAIAQGIPYEPKGDCISRKDLKDAVNSWCDDGSNDCDRFDFIDLIDQAPAVPLNLTSHDET